MDKNKWSIAKITLALLLCLQTLTVGVILLVGYFWGEEAYLKHVRGLMNAVATESVQSVESLLLPAESLAETTRALMESGVLEIEPNAQLERYFFENIKENANLSGMYFGWTNGDFLHVSYAAGTTANTPFFSKYISTDERGEQKRFYIERSASFQAMLFEEKQDKYDPRLRPWFEAINGESLLWTKPYLYFTTRAPGITVSIPVLAASGKPIGVLGIDIEISNLSYFLNKNQLSPNSSAFIANRDFRMVAHTDMDAMVLADSTEKSEFRLIKVDELDNEPINQALHKLGESGQYFLAKKIRDVRFEYDGEPHHAVFHSYNKSGLGWTVVITAPESDFIANIRTSQFWQVLIVVVASVFITLCAFLLALRFLKPVTELQERVLRDSLTRLYNRRALDQFSNTMIKEAHEKGQSVSVAMIDIDHFKLVNDIYGHATGDEVLISISQRMLRVSQKTDVLARYGGEEFVLLLFDTDLTIATSACERLRRAVFDDEVMTEKGSIPVTISIGVAKVHKGSSCIQSSLKDADNALYAAKEQGRNRVLVYQKGYDS